MKVPHLQNKHKRREIKNPNTRRIDLLRREVITRKDKIEEVKKDKRDKIIKDKIEEIRDKKDKKEEIEVTKDKTKVIKDKTEVTKDKTEETKDKIEVIRDKREEIIRKDKTEVINKMEIKEEVKEDITMPKENNPKKIKIKVIEEVDKEDIIMIIEIMTDKDKIELTNLKMRKMDKEEEVKERNTEVEIEIIKEVIIKIENHTTRERKSHTIKIDKKEPKINPNNHNKERLTHKM